MVTDSFLASLWLKNNHMAPLFNIADNTNSWVLISKYKRSRYILMLLSVNYSTFPTYFISTGYISSLAPSLDLCLYNSALLYYYCARASIKVFTYCIEAYLVHLDHIWLCIHLSHNYKILGLSVY